MLTFWYRPRLFFKQQREFVIRRQRFCLDALKSVITCEEIFLDADVSDLVKKVIGILELLFVRQTKIL